MTILYVKTITIYYYVLRDSNKEQQLRLFVAVSLSTITY